MTCPSCARRAGGAIFQRPLMTPPPADHPSSQSPDAAFEREALPWLDDVYRFALSLTRDASDADDVVQETFLRAYRSWHTYTPGSDCRRWLFTICRNVFLRSLERERPTVDLEDAERDVVGAGRVYVTMLQEGYGDLLSQVDVLPAIERAVHELPEPFRSAMILVDIEDQPYEAAAEILGVPIGTIRSRLFRGRRLVQERLLAHAQDAGLARRNPKENE
ncbi:MAG: sigma-70 family RNA polymerase sigma factor [Gemmatimonadota bacterium]|nr:sigma-70 family RNA polymerase sigma factor [Gemmatimonadota bacterium]MDE3171563.1 sigma-70 family RNA polymerase sigma factor [Gemmatimonadota bacterium]